MQVVESIRLSLANGHLVFSISSMQPADAEIKLADEKADLMREAYDIEAIDFAVSDLISR
jgi:hypothetical protein